MNIKNTIKNALKEFTNTRNLNGTILVCIENKTVVSESFGFADQLADLKCSLNTLYPIASVTKQFTATAVLKTLYDKAIINSSSEGNPDAIAQKVQQDLNRPLGYFIPEDHEIWAGSMPKWANKTTIHHLLTHSSGIPNWTRLPKFIACRNNPPEVSGMVSFLKDEELEFKPGSQFAYCNSGYFLLGELVHQITGKPLGMYMEKTFFKPLEMTSTVYVPQGTVSDLKESDPRFKNLARGYCFPVSASQVTLSEVKSYTRMQIPGGSGSLISSAPDLGKWNHALYSGKVIPDFLLNSMLAPHIKDLPMPWRRLGHNYGYGIAVTQSPQLGPIYCHHGGINGFQSGLAYIPSLKLSIVCLTNTEEKTREALHLEMAKLEEEMPSTLTSAEKTEKVWKEIQERHPQIAKNENKYNLLLFEKVLLEKLSSCAL